MQEFKNATRSQEAYFKWRFSRTEEIIELAEEYTNLKNRKILDIGCGQGALSYALSKRGAKVYSIDVEDSFLKFLKKKIKDYNIKNIKVLKGANEELPFPSEYFYLIFSFDVFEHVKDPELSFKEMVRCLKKGGYIIMELTPYYSLIAGHHLYTFTLLPAQYLPKKFMRWYIFRKKQNKRETPQSIWNQFGALNKISIKKIRRLIKQHNLTILEENFILKYPSLFQNKLASSKINWIKYFGFLKEAIPTNYQVVLRKN